MTKVELKALEKVFAAEIEDRLPYQSRSLVYMKLEKDGMVEEMTRKFPGRFAVIVNGWQLTHAGRIAYCQSCPDLPHDANRKSSAEK